MRRFDPRLLVLTTLLAVADAAPRSPPAGFQRIEELRRRAQFQDARSVAESLLADAVRDRDTASELVALRQLALTFEQMADPRAEEFERRARGLAEQLGDRVTAAMLSIDAATRHWQRGEYRQAAQLIDDALGSEPARSDSRVNAMALSVRGKIALKTGHERQAIEEFKRALAIHQIRGDLVAQAETWIDIGLTQLSLRDFAQARAAYEYSAALSQRASDPAGELEAEIQIAIDWLFQDAPREARAVLEPALERARQGDEPGMAARIEHILANALRQMGLHHDAIALYEHCAVQYQRQGHVREVAWVLARKARSEFGLGRLEAAERSLTAALSSWESVRERRAYAWWLYELGRIQRQRGQVGDARETWNRALAIQEEIELPFRGLTLSDLALLDAEQGELRVAQARAEQAVAISDAVDDSEMRWVTLYRRALIERRLERRQAALASLRKSLAVIEAMRRAVLPSDEARTGFMESRLTVYDEAVDLLVELGDVDAALELSERSRAQALAEMLGVTGPLPPISLATLRATAHRHRTTVVEYVIGEHRSVVLVLDTGGDVHAARLPLTAAELARDVASVRQSLGNASQLHALLSSLSRALIEPVSRWLPTDPEVVVTFVPHRSLLQLPFACLIDGAGRYLVETHTISYTPALHTLRPPLRWREQGPVVVVGEPSGSAPLSGAREEAKAIAGFFPAKEVSLLIGDDASESALRKSIEHARIIHLASHGVIDDTRPLDSYLALAAPASERSASNTAFDGRLTARELFALRLDRPLVTLAACDSAGGRISGDGVIGVTRGFLAANASTIAASLWRLADRPAAYQMKVFYRELLDSHGLAAQSMRRAQLATRDALRQGTLTSNSAEPLPDSPLYWAPFIVIGAPG